MTGDSTTDQDATLQGVIAVLASTLELEDDGASLDGSSPLLGELPELDSLGVVQLAVALEERFDIVIDDDEFTGEIFESVGTLTDFVHGKVAFEP
jgi:acyl carrier protein